ncbi:MAG TPA: DUF3048 domain-containing protein [Actinomycetota bacterium]|nr:DUF3048 domain-containing protein [Actinomycetota bacterium]
MALAASATVVVALVAGVLVIGGHAGVGPLSPSVTGPGLPTAPPASPTAPPPVCPLTGLEPERGTVPNRPALAVKVENLPSTRPQTGLSFADIVYEEPVEGGITRFIAIYQCRDAERILPVRSARLTDPDILVQFGRPVFGYAGAVREVIDRSVAAGLRDVNIENPRAAQAYHRDPGRPAPHNLYTSTRELYAAAGHPKGAPRPVFRYSTGRPTGRPVREIHLPFSPSSDVYWRWDPSRGAFVRFHGEEPHTYSDGTQVAAANVVVQVVQVTYTDVVDAAGARSPRVVSTGEGRAYVLRGGRVVVGTWRRPSLDDVTRFYDRRGREVRLLPGVTWVELFPSGLPVELG